MIQIRPVHTDELQQAAELANDIFCSDGERHMEYSFPSLFHPGITHSYGAFTDEGQLVSFMGLVPVRIQAGKHILSAYSIGAVCTHPDYRGQRLAGQLLEQCRQHAIDSGASLIFISGDRSLYTRAGSQFFGHVHSAVITKETAALWSSSSQQELRLMIPQDLLRVLDLLKQSTAHVEWNIVDLQQMIGASAMANIAQKQQQILVASTPQEITAVVIVGVPKENRSNSSIMNTHTNNIALSSPSSAASSSRTGSVIEWAGRPDAVRELWSEAIRRFELDTLEVKIPWQEQGMLSMIQESGATISSERNAGTVMIANSKALLAQTGLLQETANSNSLSIEVNEDGSYTLHTAHHAHPVQDDAALCSLLFHPYSEVLVEHQIGMPTIPLPFMYGLYFI